MDTQKMVLDIDLDDILPNRFQPRIKFDQSAINELADSIKEHGVIQPIIVRQIGDKYEIIAGERRYKASIIAGKRSIPVIINNLDDQQSAEVALIENVQRQDLTPIEEAVSYRKILDMGYLTQEELAAKLDRNQSTISNKLRLLNLSEEVQESLLNNKISERHARSLLRLKSEEQEKELLNKIIKERLTVRRTDEEIDKMLEETPEKTIEQNNYVDLNIPSSPIINDDYQEKIEEIEIEDIFKDEDIFSVQIEQQPIESAVSNFDINSLNTNPGFLNIDEIEQNAQDINIEKPLADIDILLKKDDNLPVIEETLIEPVIEEEPKFSGGKFFNLAFNEDEDDTPNINNNYDSSPLYNFQFEDEKNAIEEKNEMDKAIIATQNDNQIINDIVESDIFNLSINDREQEQEFNENAKFALPKIEDDLKQNIEFSNNSVINNIDNNKVDFKIVINTIRDCASKIEKEGYFIDTEELDFEDYYQVIFKINKK